MVTFSCVLCCREYCMHFKYKGNSRKGNRNIMIKKLCQNCMKSEKVYIVFIFVNKKYDMTEFFEKTSLYIIIHFTDFSCISAISLFLYCLQVSFQVSLKM